ncbi:MAG: hypothetical protein LiPW39_206 [Parcubacteria group bacterium LiPW_39]|nr:MAG: hypothetical protein LiPW39_206 [Parcubacteria group bacterium LiPW_39]
MQKYPFLFEDRKIRVGGVLTETVRVRGALGIYFDREGSPILPRLEEEEYGETPFQRRQMFPLRKRKYIRYKSLSRALRSREYSLLKAKKITVPTYQKFEQLFEESLRGAIIERSYHYPEKLSPKIQEGLREAGFVLSRARKKGIKEALVKIYFLYEDAITKELNVGALLAVDTAITDRLLERLEQTGGWVPVYYAQKDFLKLLQEDIRVLLKRTSADIRFMRKHENFSRLASSNLQQKIIEDKLQLFEKRLEPLLSIKPFGHWVSLMVNDFRLVAGRLKEGKRDAAKCILERTLLSLEMKQCQKEIEEFLLKTGRDAILNRDETETYKKWLRKFVDEFVKFKERETRVGFVERVCDSIIALLDTADKKLREGNKDEFRDAVRQAAELL